jgi:GT2 family glycosyltransferase
MQTPEISKQEQECHLAIIKSLTELLQNPEAGLSIARTLNRKRDDYLLLRQRAIRDGHQKVRIIIIGEDPEKAAQEKMAASAGHQEEVDINELIIPPDLKDTVRWVMQEIANSPADCVLLQGVSMPLVAAGMLYKLVWGAAVFSKKTSAQNNPRGTGLSINEIKTQLGRLPDTDNLEAEPWRCLALNCHERFDGRTGWQKRKSWRTIALEARLPIDGAQLNSLEALAPPISSPLMAARFCTKCESSIDWTALSTMRRRQQCASIVIPVYGESTETDNCLRSVREAKNTLQWEIIAVMNDESTANCMVVNKHKAEDRRVRLVWPGENLQFALGCNLGFSISTGTWLVVLNNDCQVKSGWLDALIAPLKTPRIAATQPRLLKPDGSVQSLGVVFSQSQTLGYPLYAGQPSTLDCTLKTHELQALTGACLAVRAKDFAYIRGFDCRYINSQEDIDLCLRLLQLPEREACLSLGSTDVLHGESRAPGRFSHSRWSRHQFVRRWANRIESDDEKIYLEDNVIIKGFTPDHLDLEYAGIGAGRPRIQPSR